MAKSSDHNSNRPRRQEVPRDPVAGDKGIARSDKLSLLRNWVGTAKSVVEHIGATRGQQVAYYHLAPIPWPQDAIAFLDWNSRKVIEYLKKRHAFDVQAAVDRISNAAKTWAEKRSKVITSAGTRAPSPEVAHDLARFTESDLPEQRRLDLDLRIIEGAVWRASFPLIARSRSSADPFCIRRLLVGWALWIEEAFAQCIRDWSVPDERTAPVIAEGAGFFAESPERWEQVNVILPRYTSIAEVPTTLAINEARDAGDLPVAYPIIKRLDEAIRGFVIEAARWPCGNVQPAKGEQLMEAVNDLVELVPIVPEGENGRPDPVDPATLDLPARARKAGEQYAQVLEALNVSNVTDRDAYDQLAVAMTQSDERPELPQFDTWQRNLREYRRLTGTQKNKPRAGRLEIGRASCRERV